MLAGPIYRVELVSVARRSRYYVMRVLYALLILLILWMSYIGAASFRSAGSLSIQQSSHLATGFFLSFSWMQLLAILAVAPAMAVGTIATERERRTIEYLFASDLSNMEIVLGKTLARLTLIGKFLLVSLPILLLFRLMGGIPADLVAGGFLIGGSTVLLVTALSVCVSVWSPRARDAMIRVYLLMAALFLLPLFLSAMAAGPASRGIGGTMVAMASDALNAINEINPLIVMIGAMGNRFSVGSTFDFAPVIHMTLWHLVLSVGCIALATAAVRRVHLREAGRGSKTKSNKPPGLHSKLMQGWRPALGQRPVVWKESFAGTARTRFGWMGVVAATLIAATVLGFTIVKFFETITSSQDYRRDEFIAYLSFLVGSIGVAIMLMLAARAAGSITQEKESDCWLSLLATPLTGKEILAGKFFGSLYAMRWPTAIIAFAWALAAVLNPSYLLVAVPMLITLLACASFAALLGLHFSMRSKTTLQSSASAMGTLLVLGGGYLMCCCPLAGFGGGAGSEIMIIMFAPCMPFLFGFPATFGTWDFGAEYFNSNGEFSYMFIAYALGTCGYAIASFVMWQNLSEQFDHKAGRVSARPLSDKPVTLVPVS
ncbi:ABC transporter permease subunit [Adhaeretor mobilis]|uniref:ABC-2 family transporter protein n=1 Tax=Adhaeretor mobilis TaxID=1930276 RepID=A0A517MZ22_9BACT|nr:ABC transporter permease subunit [Adhaeretor mobilis]QDT00115.1 ABC-2 family transporter protein [Adhaeretor mobilis]